MEDLKDPKIMLHNKILASDITCRFPLVLYNLFPSRYQRLRSQSAVDASQIYLLHQPYLAKGDPHGLNLVVLKVVNIF